MIVNKKIFMKGNQGVLEQSNGKKVSKKEDYADLFEVVAGNGDAAVDLRSK